jgi:magnesium transporter
MLEILDRLPVSRPFRRQTPGAAPGTVETLPDALPTRVTVFRYNANEFLEQPLDDINQLSSLLDKDYKLWVDVEGLGDAEVIRRLGELFHLHPLALEDVVHVHQRAKVEDYDDHLFIVARMVSTGQRLETEQISIFLGKSFVVTLQEGHPGDCLGPARDRLRRNHGRVRRAGADYLAYTILDAVIDGYFPAVEQYGERIDSLDEEIAGHRRQETITYIHRLRSELHLLRRSIWPHREAANELLRESHKLISSDTRVYLRDTYDHTVQLIDVVETYREMCSDLRDFFLSAASNRTADVMKVLTIIATIFIPLSFVAGVYGMNFHYMPELQWPFGYPMALCLMACIAAALVAFIWRRGWLSDG